MQWKLTSLQSPKKYSSIFEQSQHVLNLKTVDTIGNCQRPVFSLGISQRMHKITNLLKFELNRSSMLRDNNERKNTLVTLSCALSDAWFRDLKLYIWGENYFVLENYFTSEGVVSHNVFTINLSPLLVTK